MSHNCAHDNSNPCGLCGFTYEKKGLMTLKNILEPYNDLRYQPDVKPFKVQYRFRTGFNNIQVLQILRDTGKWEDADSYTAALLLDKIQGTEITI